VWERDRGAGLWPASAARRHKVWQLAVGSLLFRSHSLVCPLAQLDAFQALLMPGGFAFISQNATSNTIVQSIVPDELRGRVMSVYSLLSSGRRPLIAARGA